jgi:hypothetical protein
MVGTKSSLHYVGSPYQTSLSEANEKKYLNCLECKLDPVTARYSWVESLKWQIDIGPKYFKVCHLIILDTICTVLGHSAHLTHF